MSTDPIDPKRGLDALEDQAIRELTAERADVLHDLQIAVGRDFTSAPSAAVEAVRRIAAAEAERDQAHDVVIATRQMTNDANAALRDRLLAALGIENDGHTSLTGYVDALTGQLARMHEQLAEAYAAAARSATQATEAEAERASLAADHIDLAEEFAAITAQRDRTILELANTPLVELITAATEAHYIVSGRTDAMGNNPCTCDEWWDSTDGPGWDEHLAEVAVSALAAAGRLAPAGITAALPELGEHLARREAVIRTATAWRLWYGGQYDPTRSSACNDLAAAVDELPHIGETA